MHFFSFLFLCSTSICPVPATVVPAEQVNDPSVSGLEKCFDPKCNEKTDSGSCDGVVGCYWCVRDSNDAPLSKKYCADINTCYGGREGRLQFMFYCSVCIRSSFVLLLTSGCNDSLRGFRFTFFYERIGGLFSLCYCKFLIT